MKKLLARLGLAGAMLVGGATSAATIHYVEAIDGDISPNQPSFDNPSFTNLPELGIGINTVSGTTRYDQSVLEGTIDPDYFSLTIPAGTALVDWSISISNPSLENPEGGRFKSGWGLYNPPGYADYISVTFDAFTGITILDGFNFDPFGAGSYSFVQQLSRLDGGGSFDYQFQFVVAAVPIPSAIWLFGSGALGLLGYARRQR